MNEPGGVTHEQVRAELIRRVLAQRGIDPDEALRAQAARANLPPLHERLDLDAYLRELLPGSFTARMAPAHREMWHWARSIRPGVYVPAFVGVWPRGYGKSTNGEAVVVDVLARQARSYVMVVRATQGMADETVVNIGQKLRSPGVRRAYPSLAAARTGLNGRDQTWKASRVTTPHAVIDAMGLDSARRGAKVEDARPDFIILDDIDGKHDSPEITEKKVATISETILPMLADHGVVLVLQNLIIPGGVVAQLANVTPVPAAFLSNRIVSGPVPALYDGTFRHEAGEDGIVRTFITGGVPSWPEGMGLERCQSELFSSGYDGWVREKQNEVSERKGALWTRDTIARTRVTKVPEMQWVTVAVDPNATTGQTGIIVVGGAVLPNSVTGQPTVHTYTLDDRTPPPNSTPAAWGEAVVRAFEDWGADDVVGEVNNGGAMVAHVIKSIQPLDGIHGGGAHLPIRQVHAARGKYTRAQPVAVRAAEGTDHHVGVHAELETQMTSYVPTDKVSPDRLDAKVWGTVHVLQRLGDGRKPPPPPGGTVPTPRLGEVTKGAAKGNPFKL